jgi:starvation-inducible DNA-binding protein
MRRINIGLTEEQLRGVNELLNQNLADSYLLQIRTKKYHWDVVGPQFLSLHTLFETQYQTLSTNIDSYAERVRALGGYPVATMQGFLERATLKENPDRLPTATDMVAQLVDDHEQIIRNLREHIDRCSDDFHDEGTADFLTGIMEQHEDMAWMLRSFIEGQSLQPDGQVADGKKVPATV